MIRLFTISALVLMACSSFGQLSNYGVFGGITASQVDGDSYSGFNKLGFNAGGFINQHIDLNIYWQAELKYVSKGVYKGPGDYDPTLYRSSYHCLEIPLSAHYRIWPGNDIRLLVRPILLNDG